MLYRKMPGSKEDLSILGFGCMRFPTTESGEIAEDRAKQMLYTAIENGVNYIDTAYSYHDGQSECFLGQALQGGWRERVNLATKLPSWLIKTREDMDRYLQEQLDRLKTDRIDYYLVHALDQERWSNLTALGIFEFLEAAKGSGRVGRVGFSFHAELPLFKEIVDAYPWDFCQVQFNFLDREYQAGEEGVKYAAQKGLGVVVMEPLRGGKLTTNIPDEIQNLWKQAQTERSPAEWGLRWVWNYPQVSVVLSGMSSQEQVEENLRTANQAYPNSLTEAELAIVNKVRDIYQQRIKVHCTACKYCLPCPNGVDIPECFSYYNTAAMFNRYEPAKEAYLKRFQEMGSASLCIECGQCEQECPQNLPIREHLREVAGVFGK